jgi:lysophospholipase L1-like esterase
LHAQDTIAFMPSPLLDFVKRDMNVIHNPELLSPFYEKLVELRNGSKSVVNILHIGDSHIQADYLSGAMRALLQEKFGNAGLGLSFPGRAVRTNESPLIYSSSKGEWESNKITAPPTKASIGLSGATLATKGEGNTITIRTTSPDYHFNKMKLFFDKDIISYHIQVKDSAGRMLAMAGSFTDEAYPNVSKIKLPYPVSEIHLEAHKALPQQRQLTIHGVSLESSSPGILYHITGINGARYRHYVSSPEFVRQSVALEASLIIISLGTNEASDHPDLDPKISAQITQLVNELKKVNPASIILLTTPADGFKKKTLRNPGVRTLRDKIIDAASINRLPYWNLYDVAGGNHAADKWKKWELLQSDGIHFTKNGYDLQGQLLFDALVKGYNEYVRHRPN